MTGVLHTIPADFGCTSMHCDCTRDAWVAPFVEDGLRRLGEVLAKHMEFHRLYPEEA